jgi:hypothetical protein
VRPSARCRLPTVDASFDSPLLQAAKERLGNPIVQTTPTEYGDIQLKTGANSVAKTVTLLTQYDAVHRSKY